MTSAAVDQLGALIGALIGSANEGATPKLRRSSNSQENGDGVSWSISEDSIAVDDSNEQAGADREWLALGPCKRFSPTELDHLEPLRH
jgi:hypothetical protein